MLNCIRYNLILLKFEIVKLLLCNTNTTANANEIKALTRVESEMIIKKEKLNFVFEAVFLFFIQY